MSVVGNREEDYGQLEGLCHNATADGSDGVLYHKEDN